MNKNIWEKIIDFVISLIEVFINKNKEPNTTPTVNNKDGNTLKILTKTITEDLPEDVKNVAIAEGVGLLVKYNDIILNLSPAQKEYAIHVAYLKSVQRFDTLTLAELSEYADINAKALKLGIKVTEELNEFWTAFGDSLKKIIGTAANISAKAAGIALKGLLL